MGQRAKILAQILGMDGWRVRGAHLEDENGSPIVAVRGFGASPGALLVLLVDRRWTARCSTCDGLGTRLHERLPPRRWRDLSWAGHPVVPVPRAASAGQSDPW